MRLVLQIARDAVAQTHLKTLLASANATIASHRQELRMAKAELAADVSVDLRPFARFKVSKEDAAAR